MDKRYVVFDQGLATEISRINSKLTARFRNETEGQPVEMYDSLEDAKMAATVIIERYKQTLRPQPGMFSTAPKNAAHDRLAQMKALTDNDIEDYNFRF